MRSKNLGLSLCLAIVASLFMPPGLGIERAEASVTSVLFGAPNPSGGRLEMNTTHTFSGQLRCANFSVNYFAVWLEIESYTDVPISSSNREFSLNFESLKTFPVDPNATDGDQFFEVAFDTSETLTPDSKAVRARWHYWDCAGQPGSSNWAFIQTPALEVAADPQLLEVGKAPTLSWTTTVWDVFAPNLQPQRLEYPATLSGLLATNPNCEFGSNDWVGRINSQELAALDYETSFRTICEDATLRASDSWRGGAVTYTSKASHTYLSSFSPISNFLFDTVDQQSFYGGILDVGAFGADSAIFNFTNGGWDQPDWEFWFEILRPGQPNLTFDCSTFGSFRLQSLPDQNRAYALGYAPELGNTAEIVRMYTNAENYSCDKMFIFDSNQNALIAEVGGLAVFGTESALVLHSGGGTISHITLPSESFNTENPGVGQLQFLNSDFEIALPDGLALSTIRRNSLGQNIGLEVNGSGAAVHYLDLDVSGSPIAESFDITPSLVAWNLSAEDTFLTNVIFDGRYITFEVEQTTFEVEQTDVDVDDNHYIITFDTHEQRVVAALKDLDSQWCPVSSNLGYAYTSWAYYLGCQPKPVGVDRDGGLLLASPDLLMLRTETFSADVSVNQPSEIQTFATGLDYESFGNRVPTIAVNALSSEIWMSRDEFTFHRFSIPERVELAPSQSSTSHQSSGNQSPPQTTAQASAGSGPAELSPEVKKILAIEPLVPVEAGQPLNIGLERSLLKQAWIATISVQIRSSGSDAVLETVGLPIGSHDLSLDTEFGQFTFVGAVSIISPPQPVTTSYLLRFDAKASYANIRKVTLASTGSRSVNSITCAYQSNRSKTEAVCKRLSAELGSSFSVVRLHKKFKLGDGLLIRTRS